MSSSERAELDAFRRQVLVSGGKSFRLFQCGLLVLAGAVMGMSLVDSREPFDPAWTRLGAMLLLCVFVVQGDLRMWSDVRRWTERFAGDAPGCESAEAAGKARTGSEGQ